MQLRDVLLSPFVIFFDAFLLIWGPMWLFVFLIPLSSCLEEMDGNRIMFIGSICLPSWSIIWFFRLYLLRGMVIVYGVIYFYFYAVLDLDIRPFLLPTLVQITSSKPLKSRFEDRLVIQPDFIMSLCLSLSSLFSWPLITGLLKKENMWYLWMLILLYCLFHRITIQWPLIPSSWVLWIT